MIYALISHICYFTFNMGIILRTSELKKYYLVFVREKANAGNLTNFEVFDFLRSRGATSDPMGCIGSVSPSECKVFGYLSGSPAYMQTRESVNEFLRKADNFKFITSFEKLNIVNSTPTVMPALYATIKDCDKRIAKEEEQIAKENQLEEDQLQELLELVKEIFPQPAEEQEELSQ
ncbi:hypothetical protein LUZ62_022334 [Rhynchospora pubera]|uniref:DNA-directed RNA polymerase III subunit RPC9 n=1 Tax=Rhynchospora pubera TaxID=906938 RepID=A0AAV8H3F0_9POAL|nr:hypothetical protein LUZ62_022334 [Rhynchospora pubera]